MSNEVDVFDGMKEVKAAFVKFSKIGDWCKGTFIGKRVIPSNLNPGTMQTLYDFKMHAGEFHQLDPDTKQLIETPVVIESGTYWTVSGKKAIDDAMRNIKEGQIVGFKFEKINPNKNKAFNPTKVIKVLEGAMDPDFMGESADDIDPAEVVGK
jgi:hypothetical protein